ncbi:MAG: hypothetical protein KME52_06885 [Desmonostoc geniculatum HA4340-LM1]|jgi:Ca2+-binding RTX toxin-like protein|nr:hypothetical protein [Desmonostoc geniculatum HA4340-LM1]
MTTIYGTSLNDNGITRPKLIGTGAADIIYGYAGNDVIEGRGGNDIIYGDSGKDTIDGGTGNDIIDGGTEDDRLFGNDGNDTILGRSGNDFLIGGNGNDAIFGEAGNDTLWGGSGIDSLYGGTENDTYILLEDASDTIIEYANQGIDTVRSYLSYTLAANLENLELVNYRTAIIGNGNELNNSITGNTNANLLTGGAGNDNIVGRGGDDWLVGGTGNDALFGDEVFGGLSAPVGNDYLEGNDGNDILYGGGGNDTLIGGNGNDFLAGTTGSGSTTEIDRLMGNAGADTFSLGYNGSFTEIQYLGSGYAIITDFKHLENDKIRVGGSSSNYRLQTIYLVGNSAADTGIYYGSDLIGVVQDTTNVSIARDFKFS